MKTVDPVDSVPSLDANPLRVFSDWYEEACHSAELKPDACVLATATATGMPSARVILFKGLLGEDFTFYTNYQGRKGRELIENPQAALVFYWTHLDRQIRITGRVEKLSPDLSNQYFQSRPRGSQIGAVVSPQSSVIESREDLVEKVQQAEKKYSGQTIPCPDYWGGFRLIPSVIEFWINRDDRLHDRFQYQRDHSSHSTSAWKIVRLAP